MKKLFLFAFSAVLGFSACQKKVEGCLDAEAQNFQVDADRSCDSCCVYPKLQLDVAPASPFDSLRKDARGVPFRLRALTFYLSGIELLRADGSVFRVQDSVRMRVFPDSSSQFLRRDFALVKHSQFNFQVGSVVAKGEFSGLRFLVGLDDAQNRAIPKLAATGSALALQTEKMWATPDSGYFFFKLVLKKDTAAAAAESAILFEKTAGRAAVVLYFSAPKTFKKVKTAAVTIIYDLNWLLEGLDFSKPDVELSAAIRAKLPDIFEAR